MLLSYRGNTLVIVKLHDKVYLSRFEFTLHKQTHTYTNTNTNVYLRMAGWNGINLNSIFYTVLLLFLISK